MLLSKQNSRKMKLLETISFPCRQSFSPVCDLNSKFQDTTGQGGEDTFIVTLLILYCYCYCVCVCVCVCVWKMAYLYKLKSKL